MTTAAPIQSQHRGPWPGMPMTTKTTKPKTTRVHKRAALEAIVKTRDPYTGVRVTDGSKWDKLFQGAVEGDCWVMPPDETARAERALRQWLKKHEIEAIVRRQSKCEDGKGRVWLLKVLPKKGGVQ